MKQKIYKRKRIIPVGWKEIKLGDVFRTSSFTFAPGIKFIRIG